MRMCWLSSQEAEEFYKAHKEKPFFSKLIKFISSRRIVALELLANGMTLQRFNSSAY